MTEQPSITDSHCHLDFPDFEGQIDEIVARTAFKGVLVPHAKQRVIPVSAFEVVVAHLASERVIASTAFQGVIFNTATEEVIALSQIPENTL